MTMAAVNLAELGGVVAIFIGFCASLAAAWVTVKNGLTAGTIKTLQENNAALHEQNDLQAHQIALLQTRVAAQAAQIDMLKEMASAKRGVETLTDLVAANHRAVMETLRGRS